MLPRYPEQDAEWTLKTAISCLWTPDQNPVTELTGKVPVVLGVIGQQVGNPTPKIILEERPGYDLSRVRTM